MKRQSLVLSGIIILIFALILLFWWYQKTKPTQSEIQSATKSISTVNADVLDSKTTQKVDSLTVFGNVPVQIQENYQHDNLFQ